MTESNNNSLLRVIGLPVFGNLGELAELMHLDESEVKKFVVYSRHGYYYKKYWIRKQCGRKRLITQPGRRIKAIQSWILRHILDQLRPSRFAIAFRRGLTVREGLRPHEENRYFLCMDLEDFFPSIRKARVERIFTTIGYSSHCADILASLCTCQRSLPQGGVTSPALANLAAARLDRRIAGYAARRNMSFTRYADDLTVSANNPSSLTSAQRFIKMAVNDEGFKVNERKTRMLGPRRRCQINGIVKNNSTPSFGIGKRRKRRMRAIIFNRVIRGRLSPEYPTMQSIRGWISYARSVDPAGADQIEAFLDQMLQRAGYG